MAESRLSEIEQASEEVLQRERDWQQRVDMLGAANRELERDREAADRARSAIEHKLVSVRLQREALTARLQRSEAARSETEARISEVDASVREAETVAADSGADVGALKLRVEEARGTLGEAEAASRQVVAEAKTHERTRTAALQHGEQLRRELERADRRRVDVEQWLASARDTLAEGELKATSLAAEAEKAQMQVGCIGPTTRGRGA